uniref:Retrotransposon Orf1 n=1 Tax=Tanacetum cinerariifolium TaxID=118510 RepID=A0A699GWC3_TANCI|nr:retrotransposon Orf1 [Tanacetum cinerariifolium]
MRELRRKLFRGADDEDAHEHVQRVLEIADLFHFPGVTHDAVMLRVFPITLKGPALRWKSRLSAGSITTWDLLEKAFIRQYCSSFKTVKILEDIHNFKQEMDEPLYHAWERYIDLLYRCSRHDMNSQQKEGYRNTIELLEGNNVVPLRSDTIRLVQNGCSFHGLSSINIIIICSKKPNKSHDNKAKEEEEWKGKSKNISNNPPSPPDPTILLITKKVRKFNSFLESFCLVPQSSDINFICTKEDDGDVMFIEIIKKYDDSHERELEVDENTITGGLGVEYFDIFPSKSELAYHKYLMSGPIPSMFSRNPIIIGGRNFTYVSNFMIVEDISSIIDPRLSQVVLGKPFVEVSNMTHDLSLRVVRFTNGTEEIAYKIPHKIEQYNSLSDLEKEHTKSVYFRNEEDKRRGVDYVMSKILGFYKECMELGPEYLTGLEDEEGVT